MIQRFYEFPQLIMCKEGTNERLGFLQENKGFRWVRCRFREHTKPMKTIERGIWFKTKQICYLVVMLMRSSTWLGKIKVSAHASGGFGNESFPFSFSFFFLVEFYFQQVVEVKPCVLKLQWATKYCQLLESIQTSHLFHLQSL